MFSYFLENSFLKKKKEMVNRQNRESSSSSDEDDDDDAIARLREELHQLAPTPHESEDEGEDLFAEGYDRDYLNPSSQDSDEAIQTEGEDGFVVMSSDETDGEEMLYQGAGPVPAFMVEEEQRIRDEIQQGMQEDIERRLTTFGRRRKRGRDDDRSSRSRRSSEDERSSPEPQRGGSDEEDEGRVEMSPSVVSNDGQQEPPMVSMALGVEQGRETEEAATQQRQHHHHHHRTNEVYGHGEWMPQFEWASVPSTSVSEWLVQEVPRCVVKNRLYNLFMFYTTQDIITSSTAVHEGDSNEADSSGAVAGFASASLNTATTTRLPDYQARIREMTQHNAASFHLSFPHLTQVCDGHLARWLIASPSSMLELMDEVASFVTFHRLFPQYKSVVQARGIQVRIADFPACDAIRDFRQTHRNVLVSVHGVVIRRSPVHPQLFLVRYNCAKCQTLIGPVLCRADMGQHANGTISQCPACHGRGPFRVNASQTEFRNHQTLLLQESPGQVPPGRLPRSLEVILVGDLIDRVRPGDHIEVVGVYRNSFDPLLNHRQGFPIFTTLLVANNVRNRALSSSSSSGGGDRENGIFSSSLGGGEKGGGFHGDRLTEQDRRRLHQLASNPLIKRKLIRSIAPSVHGREDIKLGLLLALLGGVPKNVDHTQGHRIRGDINVLLVGDPGTAKSQFLKFVEQTADRAVYTTGRGSSAVGLTAAVHRDPISGEFALEGGALVVADRGVCLIDEFDKMTDQDRVSIHEAMEQQTISIARAGIVASLNARCSVIAAANPLHGRYDPSLSFEINVDLSPPILSRFDLLFVVRDEVDPDADTQLAQFVCASHAAAHPHAVPGGGGGDGSVPGTLLPTVASSSSTTTTTTAAVRSFVNQVDEDPSSEYPLPQATLQAYIAYCRYAVTPSLAKTQRDALVRLYRELRQEHTSGGIRIAVRHLESMLRLAEAHARMFLREYVTSSDVQAAMGLFLRCFLATQKYSMRQELSNKFRKYLEGDMETTRLLQHRLQSIVRDMRSVETRLTGVAPVLIRVDAAHMAEVAHGLGMGMDTVEEFYNSKEFEEHFTLVRNTDGTVKYIEHALGYE